MKPENFKMKGCREANKAYIISTITRLLPHKHWFYYLQGGQTLLFNNKISIDGIQEVTLLLSQHSEAIVLRAVKSADPKPVGDFL